MKHLHVIFVFLLMCICCTPIFAQKKRVVEGVVITGLVIDSITGKPIKNTIITVSGSTKQILSDKKGEFRMILFSMPDSIFYSHKKYRLKRCKLKTLNNDVVLRRKG